MNRIQMRWAMGPALLAMHAGCASPAPDRAQRMERGYVYYLDGAGGGKVWSNWSGGLHKGLKDAGYDGAGEMYSWETGLGVAADQAASNEYKRDHAAKLAAKIVAYKRAHPGAPVTLIGLSAGTAVAAFTLEALPYDTPVENVILLSGSLSSSYDLTEALRRVRGRVHIFTSQRDAVLQALMPFGGTADRDSGTTATIGVDGAALPAGASAETRELYARKIVEIPWNEEFAAYGHHGGHTDSVKAAFVERFIAPLVMGGRRAPAPVREEPARRLVDNPDYRRWAAFSPGAWVTLAGHQSTDGVRRPTRMKVTLVSRSADALIVEREYFPIEGEPAEQILPRRLFVTARIDPQSHPLTHSSTKLEKRPDARIALGARELVCTVQAIAAAGDFPDWGSNPRGVVSDNEELPGGIARIEMSTVMDGRRVEFYGQAMEFGVAPESPRSDARLEHKPAVSHLVHG